MAEKRGATGKLIYDFPTQAVLEVKLNNKWYRTTAKDFRSFDGDRRYTEPIKQPGLNESLINVKTHTIEYNGPLFAYDSNEKLPKMNSGCIHSNASWQATFKNSKKQNNFKL